MINTCNKCLTSKIAATGLNITLEYAPENRATDISNALNMLTVLAAANVQIALLEMKLARELAKKYSEEWKQVVGGGAGGAGGAVPVRHRWSATLSASLLWRGERTESMCFAR